MKPKGFGAARLWWEILEIIKAVKEGFLRGWHGTNENKKHK